MTRQVVATVGTLLLAHAAAAQFTQQGSKLVGTGSVGAASQGVSLAISGDGDTAVVGGPSDNSNAGAAWMFTRSGGVWSQLGVKTVGRDAIGPGYQGYSVAISADGSTSIVGGYADNSNAGAAWVYTTLWLGLRQQAELLGGGAAGAASQGASVAISADGTTAIVGGPWDNSYAGAAWVFARSAGVWSQQGGKLVGTSAAGSALQGQSVAISADGATAVVGGPHDNSRVGAVWVFRRNGGVWTQLGSKLVGTGAAGNTLQGEAVAISGDGTTVIVGGPGDYPGGAAWVFTNSDEVWSQQGTKLVGTGFAGAAEQGVSVAISGDGNTAIVGGPNDNSGVGATWVFTRSGSGWSQLGSKLVGTGAVGKAWQGASVAISGDGTTAIVGGPADDLYPNTTTGTGAAWVFVAESCTAPSITGQPEDQSIPGGQTATLAVSASGTTPLSYEWYQGASGDSSHPVGTGARSFTTPALTATTSYWVRVSNDCGSADSATATVSVTCTPPSITTQPQSQSVVSGQTATLSVIATGTPPLTYQWYQGGAVIGWTAVGTDTNSFTTPALTVAFTYFVRVSNACGSVDSATATVSIGCAPPEITTQPQSQTIASGQSATLSVTATGTMPLSYQWYQGNAGDTSTPVGGDASTFTTAPLISTAGYWVRVNDGCGTADSATATITIRRGPRRHLRRST